MIVVLLGGLAFQSTGYYVALLWMTLSIAFFLVSVDCFTSSYACTSYTYMFILVCIWI